MSTETNPATPAVQPSERNTRQRDAIRQAIVQAERPLSTQEILESANRRVSGIGIATVYRNVKAFLNSGDITSVTIPGDNPRYEIAGRAHHHHFHCAGCDRVYDVHHCPGDFRDIAPKGFRVDRHEITLHGLCESCLQNGTKQQSSA